MADDDITDAINKNVAEGEAIIERTREHYGFRRNDQIDRIRDRAVFPTPAPVPPVDATTSLSVSEMIERITLAEASGRTVLAALGLARLREFHEATHPGEPWPDFARKHVPLARDRVDELIGRMVHRNAVIRCTNCAAEARCPCGCGVPYASDHPWANADPLTRATALERAAEAVAAHPEKSNRALAAEIGVSYQTVRRARATAKNEAAHVSADVSQEQSP